MALEAEVEVEVEVEEEEEEEEEVVDKKDKHKDGMLKQVNQFAKP